MKNQGAALGRTVRLDATRTSTESLVFLALAAGNTGVALLDVPLWLSNLFLTGTCVFGLYFLGHPKHGLRVPPILDIGFLYGVFAYYVYPGTLSLVGGLGIASSLPQQQGLVGAMSAVFLYLRSWERWRSWKLIVGRLSGSVSRMDRFVVRALSVALLSWIAVAGLFLGDYLSQRYGTRTPGQRSPVTIGLIGFIYFGITLGAFFSMQLRTTQKRWTWFLLCWLGLAAYGAACFLVFYTRTQLLWALTLAFTCCLPYVRVSWRSLMVGALAILLLLPAFDFIGRARGALHHYDERSMLQARRAVAQTGSMTLVEMAGNSEIVGMTFRAEELIKGFEDRIFYGSFIAHSILRAPPAFVLRPLGLAEIKTLSSEYMRYFTPGGFERGEGYGLALSSELYCNFRTWGGLFGGIILFLFCVVFEWLCVRFAQPWIAVPMTTTFMISIARISGRGLESVPKPMLLVLVFAALVYVAGAGIRVVFFSGRKTSELF